MGAIVVAILTLATAHPRELATVISNSTPSHTASMSDRLTRYPWRITLATACAARGDMADMNITLVAVGYILPIYYIHLRIMSSIPLL